MILILSCGYFHKDCISKVLFVSLFFLEFNYNKLLVNLFSSLIANLIISLIELSIAKYIEENF